MWALAPTTIDPCARGLIHRRKTCRMRTFCRSREGTEETSLAGHQRLGTLPLINEDRPLPSPRFYDTSIENASMEPGVVVHPFLL